MKKNIDKSNNTTIHKQSSDDDYTQKLTEWQDKQFVSGYYTGGKIPTVYSHTARPILLGAFMIILFLVYAVIFLFAVISHGSIGTAIIVLIPSSLLFFAGLGLIRRGIKQKRINTYHKQNETNIHEN